MTTFVPTRKYTNLVLELMDEGVLSPQQVAEAALCWLSERDVKELAERYEWVQDEEDPDEGRDWGMEWYDTSTELE